MSQTSHPITPQDALQRVIEGREIFHDEMLHIMRLIMSGEMSPVMMGHYGSVACKERNHWRDHGRRAGDAGILEKSHHR